MNIQRINDTSYSVCRDDGSTVILTGKEMQEIRSYSECATLRSQVEYAVQTAEESDVISFDDWQHVGFGDYESIDDARSDFIEKVIEDITDRDELYDRNPVHTDDEVYNDVIDTAKDLDYVKE